MSRPLGIHAIPPISAFQSVRRQVVDNEWASWSLPGVACYGDSGAPTFLSPDPFGGRSGDRIVAVVSDGGWTCFSRDDRARVDTAAAQEWITDTIAGALSRGH
jgi:hypothetical protein